MNTGTAPGMMALNDTMVSTSTGSSDVYALSRAPAPGAPVAMPPFAAPRSSGARFSTATRQASRSRRRDHRVAIAGENSARIGWGTVGRSAAPMMITVTTGTSGHGDWPKPDASSSC